MAAKMAISVKTKEHDLNLNIYIYIKDVILIMATQ